MSQIKSFNTKPELSFRKFLWKNGLRGYRTKSKLKGRPDVIFTKKRIAIFVDGCFWHKCPLCFKEPKSKSNYWKEKLEKNTTRDIKTTMKLQNEGICVIRFWEHEIHQNLNECYEVVRKWYDKI